MLKTITTCNITRERWLLEDLRSIVSKVPRHKTSYEDEKNRIIGGMYLNKTWVTKELKGIEVCGFF